MIEIKDLKKSFKKDQVLRGINLTLEEGKVYGLIGRNGIGKTTLLNIIGNRIKRDSGSLLLDGEEIYENIKSVEEIALIKDTGFGVSDIKIQDLIVASRSLYKNWNEEKFQFLISEFDFQKNIKKNYKSLSRGNKTIIGIIIGIASDSSYLLLDEPTLGLDAVYRDKFNQAIFREIEDGERTIVISTHLIDESSKLFEEIIILNDGEVLLKENVEELLEKSYSVQGLKDDIMNILENKKIVNIEEFGNSIIVSILDELSISEKEAIGKVGGQIEQLNIQKLFVYLTDYK